MSLLVPISGQVTLDAQPLANATISFVPAEDGGEAMRATGFTDAEGRYRVLTLLPNTDARDCVGIVPGRYKVVLTKLAMPDGSAVPDGMDETEAVGMGAVNKVPPKYGDERRSVLNAEVPKEGNENLNFELAP